MMSQSYQSVPASSRAITEDEARVLRASVTPVRVNAIGMALFSMVMAIMINFVQDQVLVVLPLFFGFASLGLALQARKSAGNVGKLLAKGTVLEVRTVPKKMSAGRGWDFGHFSAPRSGQLGQLLADGSPVALTIAPETKHLLSVNGVALKKPIALIAPIGFEGMLAMSAGAQAKPYAQSQQGEELPPPPEGWTGDVFCPKCGQKNGPGAKFCSRCGALVPKL